MQRLIDIESMCRPPLTPTLTLIATGAPELRTRTDQQRGVTEREEGDWPCSRRRDVGNAGPRRC